MKDQAFNHKAVFPLPDKSVITEPGFIHSLKAFLEVLGLSRRNSLHLSLFSYLYNRFWDVCAGETRNFFIPCGGLQGVNGFLQQDGWRWAVPMMQPNGIVQPTLVQHWWIAFMHTHPLVYQSVLDSFRPFLPQLEGSYSAPLGEFSLGLHVGPTSAYPVLDIPRRNPAPRAASASSSNVRQATAPQGPQGPLGGPGSGPSSWLPKACRTLMVGGLKEYVHAPRKL